MSTYRQRAARAAMDTEHVEPLGAKPVGVCSSDQFNRIMTKCWEAFEQTLELSGGDRRAADRAFEAMKLHLLEHINRGGKI